MQLTENQRVEIYQKFKNVIIVGNEFVYGKPIHVDSCKCQDCMEYD